jgi:hypothetical protein
MVSEDSEDDSSEQHTAAPGLLPIPLTDTFRQRGELIVLPFEHHGGLRAL